MNKVVLTLLVLVAAAIAGVGISFAVENSFLSDRDYKNGNGTVYAHTVATGDFHSIDASMSVDVEYTCGALAPVKVVASERVLPYVTVEVKSGVLRVGMKKEYMQERKKKFGKEDKVRVYVTAPAVRSFSASTSADIVCKSDLAGIDKLTVNASTSGDVKLKSVGAKSATLDACTSGDIEIDRLEGAGAVKAVAATSGDVAVRSMAVKSLIISCSTSGDFSCKNISCDSLEADVSTSGDVVVAGTAGTLKAEANTSGDFNGGKLLVENATAMATGGSVTVNAVRCNAKTSSGGTVKNKY